MVSKREFVLWPAKTSFGIANYLGSTAWRLGVGGVRFGIDNRLIQATKSHLDRLQKDETKRRIEAEPARDKIAQGVGDLTAALALERGESVLKDEEVTVFALLLPGFGIQAVSSELIRRGVDKHQARMLEEMAEGVSPEGKS